MVPKAIVLLFLWYYLNYVVPWLKITSEATNDSITILPSVKHFKINITYKNVVIISRPYQESFTLYKRHLDEESKTNKTNSRCHLYVDFVI